MGEANKAAHQTESRQRKWELVITPSPRWVRVYFAGQLIVDSKRALLVKETGHLPLYYFPLEDIRREYLEESVFQSTCEHKGKAAYYNLRVGQRISVNAAWIYNSASSAAGKLEDHVAFFWTKVDHWFEEEEELIKHARDPYKRVDALPTSRHVKVEVNGVVAAESRRAVVVYETYHTPRYYFPLEDIRVELLEPSNLLTQCPYKGTASYLHVKANGKVYTDAVWTYPEPLPAVEAIRGLYSFYNEKIDAVYVDGVKWEQSNREMLPSQFTRL